MSKLIALALAGALVAGSAGVYGATNLMAKDLDIAVDGEVQEVRVLGGNVSDVLVDEGIELGPHDIVSPALDTPVQDEQVITVRLGRPVTLTVDGQQQTFWTTARTLGEALGELPLRTDGADMSLSSDTPISPEGASVDITTARDVTVVADGQDHAVRSTGTVDDALTAADIELGDHDILNPGPGTPLENGQRIEVVRVEFTTVQREVSVPHKKIEKKTSKLDKGETEVQTKGKDGTVTETWLERWEGGQMVASHMADSEVTEEAVDEVTLVGTKEPKPAPKASSDDDDDDDSGSSSGDSTPPSRSGGGSGSGGSGSGSGGSGSGGSGGSGNESLTPAQGNSCEASNYWQGQMTANGESFDPSAMTAAHKSLPFGTKVKVTNKRNGKSVIVRINDRGPYVGGRCLDLSRGSFSLIEDPGRGVAQVTWEIV